MKTSAIRQGWDFMAEILGAESSTEAFQDFRLETTTNEQIELKNIVIDQQNAAIDLKNQHIDRINAAIDELKNSINEHTYKGLPVSKFKGYVAEEWHAGTFNINAIRNNSENRAEAVHSNKGGSVDIDTNFGKQYSSKYYESAEKAEKAQAALFSDSKEIKYQGQERLIAEGQTKDAEYWAGRREITTKYNTEKDPVVAKNLSKAHRETAKHLTEKVSDGEGNESKPLSIKKSEQIAKEAKKGKFDPEKHNIKKSEHIEYIAKEDEYHIDYIDKALKAGLTAAAITAITQLVPEFYKAIDYLIKNGEIDVQQLKNSGVKIMSASAESFLRGSIAYGVELAIQEGLLGAAMKAVPPTVVGAMVTIVMGTIKSSILVAAGKMTPREMGVKFIDTVVISTGYLAAIKIGGIIGQALAPNLPLIGYAIGSLIGCSVAVVYNIGKKKLISFCVDTGFTCFGLVDQNYELPESVLDELGIGTANISRAEINRSQVSTTGSVGNVDRTNYETVQMTMVKRGVIGVNKVGYVV